MYCGRQMKQDFSRSRKDSQKFNHFMMGSAKFLDSLPMMYIFICNYQTTWSSGVRKKYIFLFINLIPIWNMRTKFSKHCVYKMFGYKNKLWIIVYSPAVFLFFCHYDFFFLVLCFYHFPRLNLNRYAKALENYPVINCDEIYVRCKKVMRKMCHASLMIHKIGLNPDFFVYFLARSYDWIA